MEYYCLMQEASETPAKKSPIRNLRMSRFMRHRRASGIGKLFSQFNGLTAQMAIWKTCATVFYFVAFRATPNSM